MFSEWFVTVQPRRKAATETLSLGINSDCYWVLEFYFYAYGPSSSFCAVELGAESKLSFEADFRGSKINYILEYIK